MENKCSSESVQEGYSLRLKKRDVRRWNLAQIIMAKRLGISENLEKFVKMSELFAKITDARGRPARFSGNLLFYLNAGKAATPFPLTRIQIVVNNGTVVLSVYRIHAHDPEELSGDEW